MGVLITPTQLYFLLFYININIMSIRPTVKLTDFLSEIENIRLKYMFKCYFLRRLFNRYLLLKSANSLG